MVVEQWERHIKKNKKKAKRRSPPHDVECRLYLAPCGFSRRCVNQDEFALCGNQVNPSKVVAVEL